MLNSIVDEFNYKLKNLLIQLDKNDSADVKSFYLYQISKLSETAIKKIGDIDQNRLSLGDDQLQINFNKKGD